MGIDKVKDQQKSVIISPNLGRPIFLKFDPTLKEQNFQADIIIISNVADIDEIRQSIKGIIKLNPILDYKWKLKKLFDKEAKYKTLERKKEEEKKGIWLKWKIKRLKKKLKKLIIKESKDKTTLYNVKSENIEYQLRKIKFKPFRGKSILPSVSQVKEISFTPINDVAYLEGIHPQSYLMKNKIYGNLNIFYRISLEFQLTKQIKKFLEDRNFVMFDLTLSNNRINSHSIIISKQNWENFSFVHATDLHLAERNDRIYEIIKKWEQSSIKKNIEEFFKKTIKKLKIDKLKEKRSRYLSEIKIPLRKRLINPNNQFRKFIKIMNRKVLNNELDLIILTGDLVDFTVLSRLSSKLKKVNEFKYEQSNWRIFKEIVLNISPKKFYRGMIRGEELLCPIITILGNHDYRPYHYDLTWAEMYKKIGLNSAEAIALNEMLSASPISALTKTSSALKGYLSEINPYNNFHLQLGKSLFIFLNSGADSFKNVRDLLAGHPSVTGLTSKQIKYVENLINHHIKLNSNIFLFLHGPPVNTGGGRYRINLFDKKGQKITKIKLEDFKESLIYKKGQPKSKARIDKIFNVKYGTISANWEKLIKFCLGFCILTLSGHTHTLREFKLEEPKEKTTVYDAPPFNLRKIENPAAIYFDDYSEISTPTDLIENNYRFVVQTPALGLGGYKNPKTAGAYREIIIKEGKLNSFRVKYIRR